MENPIGVIDSGVGGLTVAHEIMEQLPNEKIVYIGDTFRCPYGSRNDTEIKKFTWELVEFLLKKDIKILVIACNTATAITINELQSKLDIPVVGVIHPGARAAISNTKTNHVVVIGTEATIRSNAYSNAIHSMNNDIFVTAIPCPLFVPMIEKGILSGAKAFQIVNKTLLPLKKYKTIDTLILGCTHYPLIKDVIQKVVGSKITLVSSSEETAKEVKTLLKLKNLENRNRINEKHEFYTTGDIDIFREIASRIFKTTINNLQQVVIEKTVLTK